MHDRYDPRVMSREPMLATPGPVKHDLTNAAPDLMVLAGESLSALREAEDAAEHCVRRLSPGDPIPGNAVCVPGIPMPGTIFQRLEDVMHLSNRVNQQLKSILGRIG